MNSSEMAILPQTLLKIVVHEVGWSKIVFPKKVIQNLSKEVSIVILRPILVEISIVVTRVVKPLTTKVYPTVTYLRENILEPLSIIQSPKVYGWPQNQHSTEFLKDSPYNMAPTSRPKGGSTSKKWNFLSLHFVD